MRIRIGKATGLTLLTLCAACVTSRPSNTEMVASAEAVGTRFLDAFNKADLDAIMATYWKSPELVYFGLEGMGVKGWDAVRADWVQTFKALPGAKIKFLEHHDIVWGDVVIGSGTWRVTLPGAQVMEGRFTDVKAMRDGKWVYVYDHASVPLPPPDAAPKK